jgi:hypothetical protein
MMEKEQGLTLFVVSLVEIPNLQLRELSYFDEIE